MIFLFTWENKYWIIKTIEKRKKAFEKKYSKENIHIFKPENLKSEEIINSIFSWGLFSSKKFVVIRWYPKDTDKTNKIPENQTKKLDDFFANNLDKIPSEDVIVLVSFSPDKRTKIFKLLKEKAEIKEFKQPSIKEIENFIKTNIPNIKPKTISILLEKIWTDLFKIESEINKLKLIWLPDKEEEQIKIINYYISSQENIDQFKLLDQLIFQPEIWLKNLQKIKNKLEPLSFLWLLYWGIKNSLLIATLSKRWFNNPKQIWEKLKLHPFVVKQRLNKLDKILLEEDKLKNIFKKLINLEHNIKTGRLPIETFWNEIINIFINSN